MKELSDQILSQDAAVFEFDGFSFDRKCCLLSRNGVLIPASRKVLEILGCLLEDAPNPVSKSQLMTRVWPGVVVEETGLHRNISLLRKVLSAQTGKQYLETIPKVGYRFVGEVRHCAAANRSLDAPQASDAFGAASVGTASEIAPIAPSPLAKQSKLRRGAALFLMGCVAVTVVACYSLQPAKKEPSFRATAVTTHSQERPIVAAALDATGTQIAYAERDALFIKSVGQSDAREVKMPSGLVPSYVRWVPGNQALMLSATNPQTDESSVWTLSLNGAQPRQIIRNGTSGNTSADGRQIAFVRDRSSIWIVDADTGQERRIAEAPGTYRFVYATQFSADGQYIFDGFYKPADPQTTIEVRRVSDGKVVTSMKLPRLQAFTLFGRDSLLVSVFSSRGIPPVAIAIQKFDLAHGALGPLRKVAQWSDATAYKLTVSADARRVLLIRDRTQSDVYLADLAPQTRALQNVRRLTFDEASDFPWGWTPDSKTVLFHSLRADTFHIYEQAYDKTTPHDVVGDARDSKWPLMTADGRWLFYFSEKYPYSAGPQALTLMRERVGDAGSARPIASFTHDDVGLRCAIHSLRCVVIDQAPNSSSISNLEVDTGVLTHLFSTPLTSRHYQQWDVSPDGSQLALLNDAGIHIYDLPSGTIDREIKVGGTCALRALAWDPDGSGFYVSKTAGEVGFIDHLSTAGKERLLYTGPMLGGGWVVPSPDGNHVAFQQWVPSANVWMLEFNPNNSRAEDAIQRLAKLGL